MASGLITLGVPGDIPQVITGGLFSEAGTSNGLIALGIPHNVPQIITSGLLGNPLGLHNGLITLGIPHSIPQIITSGLLGQTGIPPIIVIAQAGGGKIRRLWQPVPGPLEDEEDEAIIMALLLALEELA